jgi:hypothetical protein
MWQLWAALRHMLRLMVQDRELARWEGQSVVMRGASYVCCRGCCWRAQKRMLECTWEATVWSQSPLLMLNDVGRVGVIDTWSN